VPWTESAQRNLIHALAAQGESNAALTQYGECRRILREELGVEPSLATQELADRLRDQSAVKPPGRHNLARQLKALIGREAEHERLHALVQRERLVTLLAWVASANLAWLRPWPRADEHFDQAEALARESDDSRIYIRSVARRSHVNALQFRDDFGKGIERLQELLTQVESLEEGENEGESELENLRIALLASLSVLAVRYGDYALALRCDRQSLAWAEGLAHQHRKGPILLGIALSEQFAGMYDQAITHNLEGLALAEAIGADDDVGLLKANLCLTMRQSGELEQGFHYGLEAIEILHTLGLVRMDGQARNRVGHTLSALGRWADAFVAYGEALVVWEPQQHSNRYEAMAGRAVSAWQLGKTDEAQTLVGEVLEFVTTQVVLGLVEPVLLLLNCEAVLSKAGQTRQARQVLRQADDWVQMIAGRISDDAVREAFLCNRRDNQLLKTKLKALRKH
jgi:tetratricopeptide (TPR) repeat protein